MALPCFRDGETEAPNEEGRGPGTNRAPPLLPTSCLVNDTLFKWVVSIPSSVKWGERGPPRGPAQGCEGAKENVKMLCAF